MLEGKPRSCGMVESGSYMVELVMWGVVALQAAEVANLAMEVYNTGILAL